MAREVLAGFENHGGRTHLGPDAEPLGRVLHGHGNNGADGLEGVAPANMIGTYLHGPLLPKNAWLADRLIALALERRTARRSSSLRSTTSWSSPPTTARSRRRARLSRPARPLAV